MKYSAPLNAITERISTRIINGRSRQPFSELLTIVAKVQALEQVATSQFPDDTQAKHAKRVANAATQLKSLVEQKQQTVNAQIAEIRNQLKREIADKALLYPRESGQEIRTVLRGMDFSKRQETLQSAIESGDHEILSAVFYGNDLTTGFAGDVRLRLIDVYQRRMAPELYSELESLDEFVNSAEIFFSTSEKAAKGAFDPKYIEKVAEDERKATEAQRQFEGVAG